MKALLTVTVFWFSPTVKVADKSAIPCVED
jgi:hypothetical protein